MKNSCKHYTLMFISGEHILKIKNGKASFNRNQLQKVLNRWDESSLILYQESIIELFVNYHLYFREYRGFMGFFYYFCYDFWRAI